MNVNNVNILLKMGHREHNNLMYLFNQHLFRGLIAAFICMTSIVSFAQNQPKIPHETINDLIVKYHATNNSNSTTTINVVPNCTLTLKNSQNVKSIKFQVISKTNQSVLYTVNYPLNSAPVTTNNNLVFSNNTSHIYLSTPNTYALGSIKLRVFTNDLQDKESKPFETN